jgi:gliding motility-associated peptidyl-prolyl isomerase
MTLKKIFLSVFLVLLIFSCQNPQARRPISQSSGTFLKSSILINKKIVKGEEALIDAEMKRNPTVTYFGSKKGFWYSYDVKNEKDRDSIKKGDIVYFDYEIKKINGDLIYSDVELRPQIYRVDEQDIMKGLRDGIKLMKNKEKVTFLFPSNMAFGMKGDGNLIPPTMPIACTVSVTEVKKNANKKEVEPKLILTPNE